jgi:hypothetical protein
MYFGPERNRRVIQVLRFDYELVCSSKVPTRSIQAQFGIVLCLTVCEGISRKTLVEL